MTNEPRYTVVQKEDWSWRIYDTLEDRLVDAPFETEAEARANISYHEGKS